MGRVYFLMGTSAFAFTAAAATIVGHPHPAEIAAGDGLTYSAGVLPIDHVIYEHCNTSTETVQYDETLDPVAGDPLIVPPGTHCGATIVLSDRFLVSGSGNGGTFALSLGVGAIVLDIDPPIVVPTDGSSGGTKLRLGIEDWVTVELLDLKPNEQVLVGAAHTLHDDLRDAIRYDSLLY
ncbi:MAG TPA: hypothetical protein ENK18_10605 [Deltaproteobacteria bacterium]|nr:hypothetical protein [Deltaproteobacteria bacterium]